MSLEYLSKYLSKDARKSSKRSRAAIVVVEDDLLGWQDDAHELADDEPTVVGEQTVHKTSKFRPAYTSTESELAARDANGTSVAQQSDGLRTKAQKGPEAENRHGQETVYRDATGRRIDIALAKQEKAKEVKREQEKKQKQQQLGQGLVQQREKAARQAEFESVRTEQFSRYAGNAEAEEILKNKVQWNDPSAPFLSKKNTDQDRPMYCGGFAVNRFGIRPGYRWDGVDRGNGFEAKRFRAIAEVNQKKAVYDEWAKGDL